ncbi:hypothetical protein [Estrella lausannensis]|uniref:Uncharacterized protein n=1 Tax=Estrella lausannensis TaxID=483423 RepID=A0A0H5DT69_9BACT|nr:hypothetical protein [Estrella lausannensis]CRX39563.1 hypothetical protein ELAC_2243 [Estrella lausannensis]
MALDPTTLPSALVFSDEGPRGAWASVQLNKHDLPSHEKVLAAGNFGLMPYQRETNLFLKSVGLPEACYIEQPEFEGFMKRYFILTVSHEDFETKIESARQSNSKMEVIQKLAAEAFLN